jgi:lysophospholipase
VLRSGGDLIVSNDAIDEIHQKLKDSEILTIENAMHELLFEKDSMREQCLNTIEQFLSR